MSPVLAVVTPRRSEPGAVEWAFLDVVRPIIYARNVAFSLAAKGPMAVRYRWSGLEGRVLALLDQRRVGFRLRQYQTEEDAWDHTVVLEGDTDLHAAARAAVERLFDLFLWTPNDRYLDDMIGTMLGGRFPH